MRRRNMGNKVVRRAITWAMVLMLSFSAGLSSMATMTVYAVDNRVDDCELEKERVDSTAERFNDKETSEDPAAEAALAKADEAKSAAENAAKTVENLQKTIDDLEVEKKVEAAGAEGTGETESTGAVKAAEDAAASAEAAAGKAAKTAAEAEAKKDEISKIAEDYNKTFENNQSAADSVTAEGLTSVKGENGASDTELDKYVEEQAKAAREAQQEAQAKLEEALKGGAADDKVSTADGEKTVKELVGEVDQAAADAAKAADDAQAAVDQANQNVADAKVKYNAYAMMYGLPLYGEKDVTYTYDADSFAKAGITDAALQAEIQKQLVDRNAVNAGKEEIENAGIKALENEIQNAKTTADTAQKTAKDALKAAEDAEKAAEDAKKLLTNEEGTGSVDKTNTAAEKAVDAEVKAAETEKINAENAVRDAAGRKAQAEADQAKVNTEQDKVITDKTKEKTDYEADLKSVKDTIREQEKKKADAEKIIDELENKGILNLETAEIDKAKAMSEAKVGEWSWSLLRKVTQADIDNANATIKKYNDAKADKKNAETELTDKKAEKAELEKKISDVDSAIVTANNKKQAAANAVDAAAAELDHANADLKEKDKIYQDQTAARDQRVAQADKAYDEMLKNGTSDIINNVKKALSDNSDGINQVEYDKELNAWANTTFDKYDEVKVNWKIWETAAEIAKIYDDAKDTRRWMDNEYNASKVQEIFNYLGITQWAVSTAQREAAMDAIIKAYRENMAEYEKQLAAINAQDAKNSAEASAKAAEDIAKTAEASKNAAQAAENVISTAQDTITAAEDTYNDAKKKLDAVKSAAKNVNTPTTLELQRLFEQIQKAEQKVEAAEKSLKEAVAAKKAAESFKKWADSLITDQYTRAYAQAAADENGKKTPLTENLKNYDTSNDKVISRPTSDFVCVSKGTSSVKVPYTIYRDYVNLMYQKDYDSKPKGKGISTGSKMDVIYWEVGTDGKLSGDYFTSPDELTTGSTYFIGYTFKYENDGYHIDGLMYKYEDSKEEPTTSPSAAPSTAPSTTPSGIPSEAPVGGGGGTTGTTVTIEEQAVPLAAVPADAPAVLGARRAAQDEKPAVLGVKRGTDQAVLGKRRSPKTGDSTEVFAWAGAMAIAGAAAVVSGTKLAKKKEEE